VDFVVLEERSGLNGGRRIAQRTLRSAVGAVLLFIAMMSVWLDAAYARRQAWTIPDIVQIKRIVGTAVLGQLRVAAFILKAPVLADDRNHYQLFEIAPGSAPTLLAQATFMSNLEWRPGTRDWTLRADFGHGVQLYEVSLAGRVTPLLIVTPCVLVGGWEGLVRGDSGKPRLTGVLSYQWAPDGLRYWYSRVRLRSDAAQKRRTHGIVYNDAEMLGAEPADFRRAIKYAGTELHVVDVRTGADRMVRLSL
jgi:hypothetical protein